MIARWFDDLSTRCQFHLTPMRLLNGGCGDVMVHQHHGDDTNRPPIPDILSHLRSCPTQSILVRWHDDGAGDFIDCGDDAWMRPTLR
jgi:hypothetical protein